jgi:hypothetical protein
MDGCFSIGSIQNSLYGIIVVDALIFYNAIVDFYRKVYMYQINAVK